MATTKIDYEVVFRTMPGAISLLTLEGVILDVNEGYLEAAGRSREQVLGRSIFDAFPQNPYDPGVGGPDMVRDSLRGVAASGERDVMMPIRYDVEDPGRPGEFEERYWAVINTPMLGADGRVVMILSKADEVTHIVNRIRSMLADQG